VSVGAAAAAKASYGSLRDSPSQPTASGAASPAEVYSYSYSRWDNTVVSNNTQAKHKGKSHNNRVPKAAARGSNAKSHSNYTRFDDESENVTHSPEDDDNGNRNSYADFDDNNEHDDTFSDESDNFPFPSDRFPATPYPAVTPALSAPLHTGSSSTDDEESIFQMSSFCNCLGVDWLLCCFGCLTLAGCRHRIAERLVYFPPKPPMYIVLNNNNSNSNSAGANAELNSNAANDNATVSCSNSNAVAGPQTFWCIDIDNDNERVEPISEPEGRYEMIPTSMGHKIATLWIPCHAAVAEGCNLNPSGNNNNNNSNANGASASEIVSALVTGTKASAQAEAEASLAAAAAAEDENAFANLTGGSNAAPNATGSKASNSFYSEDFVNSASPTTSANAAAAEAAAAAAAAATPPHLRQRARVTLLFSHGNAADLGAMKPQLLRLARRLNVNVFAYDYSGYGLSEGRATPRNTLADAEAALLYLKAKYPRWSEKVICYGQSLGSAPSIYLGATHKDKVAGVVIHSGLMSALRCVRPNLNSTYFFDIFPNVDLVKSVEAPLLVIHGGKDRDIPRTHGEMLVANAPRPYKPWFAPNAGHNNVELKYSALYEAKLDEFVADVVAGAAATRFTKAECVAGFADPGAIAVAAAAVAAAGGHSVPGAVAMATVPTANAPASNRTSNSGSNKTGAAGAAGAGAGAAAATGAGASSSINSSDQKYIVTGK